MDIFPCRVTWRGSTATREYGVDAVASAPGKPELAMSSGHGDPMRWNPEDTLAASLSMCHMLTFLALASKVGVDVRSYDGDAEAELGTVERVTSVTRITLKPTIGLAPGADHDKAAVMFHKAHKYCFIANSVKSEVVMTPTFVTVDG